MAQENARKKQKKTRTKKYRKPVNWLILLIIMTVFQLVCAAQINMNSPDIPLTTLYIVFGAYIAIEWAYLLFFGGFLHRKIFEIELIAFFLTGIGLTLTTSVYPDKAFVQLAAVIMGIAVFIVMLWVLSDIERVVKLRMPVAIASVIVLVATRLLAHNINGAYNWIRIGGVSIQPSEIVKIGFGYARIPAINEKPYKISCVCTFLYRLSVPYEGFRYGTYILLYILNNGISALGRYKDNISCMRGSSRRRRSCAYV